MFTRGAPRNSVRNMVALRWWGVAPTHSAAWRVPVGSSARDCERLATCSSESMVRAVRDAVRKAHAQIQHCVECVDAEFTFPLIVAAMQKNDLPLEVLIRFCLNLAETTSSAQRRVRRSVILKASRHHVVLLAL